MVGTFHFAHPTFCKKGDVIKQGYNIAKSGSTGVGKAAHLHFGVHKNNLPVNPLDYLPSF